MKYLVTIEISGTKTYQFNNSTDFWLNEDEFRIWAHDNVERFDNMTNPISDSEHREIKDIKVVIPTMSKKQVYDKLFNYITETTPDSKLLEMLKMLKILEPQE
jgi:hypothetical protein